MTAECKLWAAGGEYEDGGVAAAAVGVVDPESGADTAAAQTQHCSR